MPVQASNGIALPLPLHRKVTLEILQSGIILVEVIPFRYSMVSGCNEPGFTYTVNGINVQVLCTVFYR